MKKYKPVLIAFSVAMVLYLLHKLIFHFFGNLQVTNPTFSLEELYSFFSIFSIVIIILQIKISEKSFDNLGMVFLIATSIKMIACYFMLHPILKAAAENGKMEKINFFVMFILFLAIETVITIRILNNKQ